MRTGDGQMAYGRKHKGFEVAADLLDIAADVQRDVGRVPVRAPRDVHEQRVQRLRDPVDASVPGATAHTRRQPQRTEQGGARVQAGSQAVDTGRRPRREELEGEILVARLLVAPDLLDQFHG